MITFNIMFGGTLLEGEQEIDFSAGIPGLNLSTDASLLAKIDYLMGIGLGIGDTSDEEGMQFGAFVDTSGINTAGEEVALDIAGGVRVGDSLDATLGFLAVDLTDVTEDTQMINVDGEDILMGSRIVGHLGLDIIDGNGDGRWVFGEDVEFVMNASIAAQADLFVEVSTIAGDFLPAISTTIRYDQVLGDFSMSSDSGAVFDMGAPELILEDVTLDIGSVFDSFLGDTLDVISDIIMPMKPVVDLLTMELDLGITKFQMIDLAYLRLPAKTVDVAKKVLNVLKATLDFLETVGSLSEAGELNFGTFNLTESFATDPDAESSDADLAGATSDSQRTAQMGSHAETIAGPDQEGLDGKSTSSRTSGTSEKRWSIPVLEDPATLLDFVLGRGEVDLFYYDLPDLDLDFEYSQSYMVFPGLNAGFFGEISAYTNFDFGYDTRGLRQWMETDFDLAESWRLINGLYLDDHGRENTPEDEPEVGFRAAVGVSASLGIGGLVEAGVRGGIEAIIEFDLNDKETAFENDLPIGDGKLYGSELFERIGQGPECLFDVHGELNVFLEAFLWIGIDLGFSEITLFEAEERFIDETIVEFDWECVLDSEEELANLSGGVLTIADISSGDHGTNLNIEAVTIDSDLTLESMVVNGRIDTEYYTSGEEVTLRDMLAGWRDSYPDEEVVIVSTGLRMEIFLARDVNSIDINGSSKLDRYTFKRINAAVSAITGDLRGGDDIITFTGDDEAALLTSLDINLGSGNDYFMIDTSMLAAAADDSYRIYGDAGDDRLKTSGQNYVYSGLTFFGGTGDDILMGGAGSDRLFGGIGNNAESGFDVIYGGIGDDYLDGGDEYSISLYLNRDGEKRNSEIYQPDGSAYAFYNEIGLPVTMTVDGSGLYVLDGDTGLYLKVESGGTHRADLIDLNGVNIVLRNHHGDFLVGDDSDEETFDGDDVIYGGYGFDKIFGNGGTNELYGEEGDDIIDAGTGSVVADGGGGDDLIQWIYSNIPYGETLDISGGAGDDILDVTVDPNNDSVDVVSVEYSGSGTAATFTINDDSLNLDLVEELKIDLGSLGDELIIGDLLDTTIQNVDVVLGTAKATMWQVQYDQEKDQQVYSLSFTAFDGDPDVRTAQYFYRYDIQDGGRYLFNEDASPELISVDTESEIDGAYVDQSVQEIYLADGLDIVTVYYGYDDEVVDNARTGSNSVELNSSMSAAEVETALETSIGAIVDVTVTGSGTAAEPWIVTFHDATTDVGNVYRQLATHYYYQNFVGTLIERDDVRVYDKFYRVQDDSAEYLFNNDGSANLVDISDDIEAVSSLDFQLISLPSTATDGILWYGNNGVAIDSTTTAGELQSRLSSLLSLTATVSGSGTTSDPWLIDLSGTSPTELFEFVMGGSALATNLVITRTSDAAIEDAAAILNSRQSLVIPYNATNIDFSYNGANGSVTFDLSSEAEMDRVAQLETALKNIAGIVDVEVFTGANSSEPWTVVILSADDDGFGEYFELEYTVTNQVGSQRWSDNSGSTLDGESQLVNDVQTFFLNETDALLWYGQDSITINGSMTTGQLQTAIEQFESITVDSDVSVTGSGTEGTPWVVTLTLKEGGLGNWTQMVIADIEEPSTLFDKTATVLSNLNGIQDLVAAEPITIFYGDSGVDVNYTGSITAADIKTALESLQEINEVIVTGSGTWHIVIIEADLVDGEFAEISGERYAQGSYIQTASSDVVRQGYTGNDGSFTLALDEWMENMELRYAGDSVEIGFGMSRTELSNALESMDSIREVSIAGSGTVAEPWIIALIDADLDGESPYAMQQIISIQLMQRELNLIEVDDLTYQAIDQSDIAAGTVLYFEGFDTTLAAGDIASLGALKTKIDNAFASDVTITQGDGNYYFDFGNSNISVFLFDSGGGVTAAVADVLTSAYLQLPQGITGVTLMYNSLTEHVDFDPDKEANVNAADIETALDIWFNGADISVTGGIGNDPLVIFLENYNPSLPVVIEYEFETFDVLFESTSSAMRVVEQIGDSGYEVLVDSEDDHAVFGLDESAGADLYISAYRTIERNLPRMIEKDVWADLDGDGSVERTGETDWFEDPTWENDKTQDSVTVTGGDLGDYFLVGHQYLDEGEVDEEENPILSRQSDTVQVSHQRLVDGEVSTDPEERTMFITIHGIDLVGLNESIIYDVVAVDGADGDDRIIAGYIPNSTEIEGSQILTARAVDNLTLIGGAGNDRIVGTGYADTIIGGTDNDIITGGAGVDTFSDTSGFDTLIEARALNFSLSDTDLLVAGEEEDPLDAELMVSIEELETTMSLFENFLLYGGASANNFAINNFTKGGIFDGTEGSDTYVMTLSGAIVGASLVAVVDSGTGSTDNDTIEIWGADDSADTMHLDVDTSRQIIERLTTANFTLTYDGAETADIVDGDEADDIEAKLEAALAGLDVEVTGTGTDEDPWLVEFLSANAENKNAEDKFFKLISSDEGIAKAAVERAYVERVKSDLVEGLLDSKPVLDDFFENAINEIQLFNLFAGQSGTFQLSYNGETTAEVFTQTTASTDLSIVDINASEIETALENLSTIGDVTVTGLGTSRNPWRVELLDADIDNKENFFELETENTSNEQLVNGPADIADAAATTRLSASLSNPTDFQRIYYDRTVENVEIHGGGGNDTFISDDSMAATKVYGDGGADNFIIGRVIATKSVEIDGRFIEVIDGLEGVTAGVSYNGDFYGGSGDDYFEVNHNVGVLRLFGESGDDMFFLKAQLQETGEEVDGGDIIAGAGDEEGNIESTDDDALIDYVQNNRVEIYGGSGFDTLVVAGTALDDEFYIFTDNDDQQYLYGAGLKLEKIVDIERLALITGAGADTVYIYGLSKDLNLLINMGSGDDTVILGGEQKTFEVKYPESNAIYTVEQLLLEDVVDSQDWTYNDVILQKKAYNADAFKAFYERWVGTELLDQLNITSSATDRYWRLLEANFSTALKLFAQGVEFAYENPVHGTYLQTLESHGTGYWAAPHYHTWGSTPRDYAYGLDDLEDALLDANWIDQNENGNYDINESLYGSYIDHGEADWERNFPSNPTPVLPDTINLETLKAIIPADNLYAKNRTVDKVLYNEYLSWVVTRTNWGDFLHGDQIQESSNYIQGAEEIDTSPWGYDMDLYLTDMYTAELNVSGSRMAHIHGESDGIHPHGYSAGAGADMFWDLISMFYEVNAEQNELVNYEVNYSAQTYEDAAAYRFDDLPERIVEKILPENYDLNRIKGVIRIGGGSGNDSVEVNAEIAGGASIVIGTQTVNLADYIFDTGQLDLSGTGISHEDVQSALSRDNKYLDFGLLDQMENNDIASHTVTISIDEEVVSERRTLEEELDNLASALDGLAALAEPEDVEYKQAVTDFLSKGYELLGLEYSSTASFSLDALDALQNDSILANLILDGIGGASSLETSLLDLEAFLTLVSVKEGLQVNYDLSTDSALKVYSQTDIIVNNRTTTYKYTQEIWDTATYDEAQTWNNKSGIYSGRELFGQDYASLDIEDLRDNDLDNERGTQALLQIAYNVDGIEGTIGELDGSILNEIEGVKDYVAEIDNYNKAYYTYSYYGVDANGDKMLESVAVRRLNDTDNTAGPAVVAGSSELDGGVYLSAENWTDYLNQLEAEGLIDTAKNSELAVLEFTDENVTRLVVEGLSQVLRTDIKAPIIDGLIIVEKAGDQEEAVIDIKALQDTAGFYLPYYVSLNKIVDSEITVLSSYVTGSTDNYEITLDAITGANENGIYFASIENADYSINEFASPTTVDDITILDAFGLDTITVSTGNGADIFDINADADISNLIVYSGDGADQFTIEETATTAERIAANITIFAGNGADSFLIDVTKEVGDITITAGSATNNLDLTNIGTIGNLTADLGDGTQTINLDSNDTIGDIDITGGSGVDTYNVTLAGSIGNIDIVSGGANDVLDLINTGTAGYLNANMGNGTNDIDINSSNVIGNIDIVTGTGNDDLTLINTGTVGYLNANLGSGTNDIDINSSAEIGNIDIVTGTGNDDFTLTNTGEAGYLNVSMGDGINDIVIDSSDEIGNIDISSGSGVDTYDLTLSGTVGTVDVDSGAANDVLTLKNSATAGTVTINTEGGNDTLNIWQSSSVLNINTGSENDTINIGSVGNSYDLTAMTADINIIGNSNTDILNVDARYSSIGLTGVMSQGQISGFGMSGNINYDETVETLNFYLSEYDDTVNIHGVSIITNLYTLNGNDTVNIHNSSYKLDDIGTNASDLLTLYLGSGTDTVNIIAAGEIGLQSHELTNTTFDSNSMLSTVVYDNVEELNLSLGYGQDTLTVLSTHANTTNINTNESADTVNFGNAGDTTNIDGIVNVDMGSLQVLSSAVLEINSADQGLALTVSGDASELDLGAMAVSIGDIWNLELDGTTAFIYVVALGDTLAHILGAFKSKINGQRYKAYVKEDDSIEVYDNYGDIATTSTYAVSRNNSGTTIDANELWEVTIDGIEYTYITTGNETRQVIAAKLQNLLRNHQAPAYSAELAASGDDVDILLIKGIDTLNVDDSNNGYYFGAGDLTTYEAAIAANQDQLQALIDLVVDYDETITDINNAQAQVFGEIETLQSQISGIQSEIDISTGSELTDLQDELQSFYDELYANAETFYAIYYNGTDAIYDLHAAITQSGAADVQMTMAQLSTIASDGSLTVPASFDETDASAAAASIDLLKAKIALIRAENLKATSYYDVESDAIINGDDSTPGSLAYQQKLIADDFALYAVARTIDYDDASDTHTITHNYNDNGPTQIAINYENANALNLTYGDGIDFITIDGLSADYTTIHAGANYDTFNIDATSGQVDVYGGEDVDTFLINGVSQLDENGVVTLIGGADSGDDFTFVQNPESLGKLYIVGGGEGHDPSDNYTNNGVGIDSLQYLGSDDADVSDIIQFDTAYDRAWDYGNDFSNSRWTEYGIHQDGLIISHTTGAEGYDVNSAEDAEALLDVSVTSLNNVNMIDITAPISTDNWLVEISGKVVENDVWTLAINNKEYSYTVLEADTEIADIAAGILAELNTDSGLFDSLSINENIITIESSDLIRDNFTYDVPNDKGLQVLNYSTIDAITFHAQDGDDKIISDDTTMKIEFYGDDGDDEFYIGSILSTETVLVEGREITVVIEVTNGVNYQDTAFHGGKGDDYFEVTHNAADIQLYGDQGDDTFFIKALLTLNDEGEAQLLESQQANIFSAAEGADLGIPEVDSDTIIYMENANVDIDGGTGFDSVAIVGTALSDVFFVYAELNDEGEVVQRVYGAGLKIREMINIERLTLITGAGDDTVYVMSTDLGPNSDMVINAGSGSDTIYI
ncbi:MAG: hypothetical protein HRT89_00050, partial [Lentisphaeria bacterium]|nr:hypothetical protein [Lentisphaeria bacterium]